MSKYFNYFNTVIEIISNFIKKAQYFLIFQQFFSEFCFENTRML